MCTPCSCSLTADRSSALPGQSVHPALVSHGPPHSLSSHTPIGHSIDSPTPQHGCADVRQQRHGVAAAQRECTETSLPRDNLFGQSDPSCTRSERAEGDRLASTSHAPCLTRVCPACLSSFFRQGWEARADRTGRLYFVDHVRKCTSWEDPRPLPMGWECKLDEKLKRKYFVDHSTRSTSWTDPRPPIVLSVPRSAPVVAPNPNSSAEGMPSSIGSGTSSSGEPSRIRTAYDGSHQQDLDWYRDVLQMSLADKSLTPDEDALLASVRQKLKISADDHRTILKECGWTIEEFEGIRKEDPWRRECCLCLDAPADHIILDCLPESDTRVLTNQGFLFLDEIEARVKRGDETDMSDEQARLLFACYDIATAGLQYHPGQLVYSQDKPQHLVDFTDRRTRDMWTPDASETATTGVNNADSNHVSLRVTPNHRMFVQMCDRSTAAGPVATEVEARTHHGAEMPFRTITADQLTAGFKCECGDSCTAADACMHPRTASSTLRFLAHAAGGFQPIAPMSVDTIASVDSALPVHQLPVATSAQLDAFLELYGCWLACGRLEYPADASNDATGRILFHAPNGTHLSCLLEQAGLRAEDLDGAAITHPAYWSFFEREYWLQHPQGRATRATTTDSVESAKLTELESRGIDRADVHRGTWLMSWVLDHLDMRQVRLVLRGMQQQQQENTEHGITTSSISFREQLLRAALHAGYSSRFERDECTSAWRVLFSDAEHTRPVIPVEDVAFDGQNVLAGASLDSSVVLPSPYDATEDGRLWCVRVAHSDHLIVAQRANRGGLRRSDVATRAVTRASRPIVVGNCFHLCLCEKCSKSLAQQEVDPGKEKTCPKCRSVIRVIHKVY